MKQDSLVRAGLTGGAVFVIFKVLATAWPILESHGFGQPAARAAALFLGVPCSQSAPDTFTVAHPVLEISVVPVCSGFTFFCLTCALLAGLHARHRSLPAALTSLLPLIPGLYLLTVITNAGRIVCAFYLRAAGSARFHELFGDVLHLAVGVGIFLPVLILTYLFTQRRLQHA